MSERPRDVMVIYNEQVKDEIERLSYSHGVRRVGNGAEDAMVAREKIVLRAEEAVKRAYEQAATQLLELRNVLQHIPTPPQSQEEADG